MTVFPKSRLFPQPARRVRLQRDVDKERLIKCSILAGEQNFHLLLVLGVRVGSRFWGHSAMTFHGLLAQ